MGITSSRYQYLDMAHEALDNSRALSDGIDGPPIEDVLVRYLEGRLEAEELVEQVSPLEVSLILLAAHGYL